MILVSRDRLHAFDALANDYAVFFRGTCNLELDDGMCAHG